MGFCANLNSGEVSHLKIFRIPGLLNEGCMSQKEHLRSSPVCCHSKCMLGGGDPLHGDGSGVGKLDWSPYVNTWNCVLLSKYTRIPSCEQ